VQIGPVQNHFDVRQRKAARFRVRIIEYNAVLVNQKVAQVILAEQHNSRNCNQLALLGRNLKQPKSSAFFRGGLPLPGAAEPL
jgi:hypothetical protein